MEGACRWLFLCWLCWARGEDGAHRGSQWSEDQEEDPSQGLDGGPKRDLPTESQEVLVHVMGQRDKLGLEEALKEGPPSHLQVLLETEGGPLFLELQQNEVLLSGTHTLVFYLPNGTRVSEDGTGQVNCYYHGQVKGHLGSWISASACGGLRGHLAVSGNRSYGVQPVSGPGDPRHFFFEIQDTAFPDTKCGLTQWTPVHPSGEDSSRLHRRKRDLVGEVKYIELAIVTDKKEYEYYHGDIRRLQIRMLEIANQVDLFFRPLNVRVALVAVEIWNKMDQITVDQNPSVTLNRFLAWRQAELLPHIRHDNAQLVIGGKFEGSAVGMATQASMCSPERSGGVNMDHSVSTLGVASTIAHELGHNLGMNHDTVDRKCNCSNLLQVKSCIMEPATGFLPGLGFSSCSRSDLETSLRQGGGMCLFNVPEAQRIFGAQRCGNLFVEVGEECDCGLTEVCKDPCCNATTCKLVPGAKCSSSGICCEKCQLRHSGSVCREPLGECDLPEYCDGVSSFCPPNVFLQDGHPCKNGQAFCYSGDCRTYESQCQVLWGPGSTQAPDDCFRSVNMKGDKYGNCGRNLNGTYIPCRAQDMKCGKIQCQGGNDRPLLGSNAEVVNHRETACRSAFFNLGEDIMDPAMVMPGTACGSGKVCINQKCQEVSALGVQECRRKCSGHGVCNSNANCHCDPGWAPPDCKSSGYGGSVESGPLEPEKDSSAVSTALLLLFLLVLPLTILVGVCYFKRSTLRQGLCRFRKASSCQYSAEPETRVRFLGEGVTAEGNRISHTEARAMGQAPPERPRPPQRMQSTELQVMPPTTKPQVPVKPPPPKKPLPSDPATQDQEELLSAVPIYTPQAVVFPSSRRPLRLQPLVGTSRRSKCN
uniref:Disintegrin and metalloproteinase domain-containing protein 15 isoform X5 n=1 Tax=Geotrypetes seraphini TaxID=260995 RepID=A0A6P8Q0P5_GEOSA|nr:disintegrin and metalloproteinase domain-containing protein 15 isoform X5 [Geotrypetes seraphini]